MVKWNLLSNRSLLVTLGAIQSCSLFIPAARHAEAADRGQQRASLSVVNLENDIQLVQVVGPIEGPVVSEEIDQHKQTYVMLRGVPDAMQVIGNLSKTVPIRGVTLQGSGLDDAGLRSLAEQHPHLKTLILQSPRSLPPDEYADFTDAELARLVSLQLSPSGLQTIQRFEELRILELVGYRLPPSRLQMLSEMPDLASVALKICNVRDADLQALAALPNLIYLGLTGTGVSGEGVMHLRGCRQLRQLNLDRTEVGDEIVSVFNNHRWEHLKIVSVHESRLSETGLGSLRDAIPFTQVINTDTSIDGLTPTTAVRPQQLRQHRASACLVMYFGRAELKFVDGRVVQVKLPARSDVPTDKLLLHVANMSDLRTLLLAGRKVSAAGLRHLAGMTSLEGLDLQDATVDDEAMREVARISALRRLNLTGTRVGDLGIRHLRQARNLEELSLMNTSVTDASLEAIANLSKLRKLDLENCSITDAGIDYLLTLDELDTVDMQGTNTSQEAKTRIYNHTQSVRLRSRRAK